MRATVIAAAGHLLSGATIPFSTSDLNSESISVLVEYQNFDFIVSGDLTGGGASTAKTPDIESYVGQMVGDVDVVQLSHHGSTTTSGQRYLTAVKAEVALAQAGFTNTFGHPNRETANKFLNTPTTTGHSFSGTGVPAPGLGPVVYQPEESPDNDVRVTHQAYTGSDAAGAVDGASPGLTTDFSPTVVVSITPEVPLATDAVVVSAMVNDRESAIASVALSYSLNGTAQAPLPMVLNGGVYQATIPPQPDGTRVEYAVTGSTGPQTTASGGGYFSGVTAIASLRELNAKGEARYAGYPARSGVFASGTNDDYLQDATGAINVFRVTQTSTPFVSTVAGQTVEVKGLVGSLGGRVRLDTTQSLEKPASPFGITTLASGSSPEPLVVTMAQLNANPEAYEGKLVSICRAGGRQLRHGVGRHGIVPVEDG